MGECIFHEEAPEIIIRGDLVFLQHTDGRSVATTLKSLQIFIARANRALDEWHERIGNTVVRFPRREH